MYLFHNLEEDLLHFGLENKFDDDCSVEDDTHVMGRYNRLSYIQKRDYIYEHLKFEGKGREKEFFPELYEEEQERIRKREEAVDAAEDARWDWLMSLPPEERYKYTLFNWPREEESIEDKYMKRALKK